MKHIQVVQPRIFQTSQHVTSSFWLHSPHWHLKNLSMEHTHRYDKLKYNQLVISNDKWFGFLDSFNGKEKEMKEGPEH